jgi:hypothetical protein
MTPIDRLIAIGPTDGKNFDRASAIEGIDSGDMFKLFRAIHHIPEDVMLPVSVISKLWDMQQAWLWS